jgi:lactaldehyde dehydrogenase / glycolaldehyde dehydrogenase
MAFSKNRLEAGVHTSGFTAVEKTGIKHLPISHRFPFPTSAALYIGDELVDSLSGEFFPTFNPSSEEGIRDVPHARREDIESAIAAAKAAYTEWESVPYYERAYHLRRVLGLIESQTDLFVYMEGVDGGTTVANSLADVRICCSTMRAMFQICSPAPDIAGVQYESCGVLVILLPSTNPLSLFARSVVPALLRGNTVVAVIDDGAPLASLQLASVFIQSRLPKGILNIVTGSKALKDLPLMAHPSALKDLPLMAQPDVSRVIVVGDACSSETLLSLLPQGISQTFREYSGYNKPRLELLGRSSAPMPAIVSSRVDVKKAADAVVQAVFIRSLSVKTKWILVHDSVYDSFLDAIVARYAIGANIYAFISRYSFAN